MKKIVDYKIVQADSTLGLTKIVRGYLCDDWHPLDGVVSFKDEYSKRIYAQTLIKYGEEDEPI